MLGRFHLAVQIETGLHQHFRMTEQALGRRPVVSEFRATLLKALRQSADTNRSYIGLDVLQGLNVVTTIRDEISHHAEEESDVNRLASHISHSSFRLFCILVLLELTDKAAAAVDGELTDADLPLTRYPSSESELSKIVVLSKILGDNEHISDFMNTQWLVLCPVFDRLGQHELLPDEAILPFLSITAMSVRGSRLKTIKGAQIDAAQSRLQGVKDCRSGLVAGTPTVRCVVKTSTDFTRAESERSVLLACNDVRHPHIIPLLASYLQHEKLHLLLPEARCDLRSLWTDDPNDIRCSIRGLQDWAFDQILGLTEGLAVIHEELRSNGRLMHVLHGDLVAQNILVLDYGRLIPTAWILKLADFDSCSFSYDDASMPYRGKHGTYYSPELLLAPSATSASDIWSLGCLILEFCIWLQDGPPGLEAFSIARRQIDYSSGTAFANDFFFRLASPTPDSGGVPSEVNSAVVHSLLVLQHSSLAPGLRDMLRLIEQHVLQIVVQKRKTARDMVRVLSNLSFTA